MTVTIQLHHIYRVTAVVVDAGLAEGTAFRRTRVSLMPRPPPLGGRASRPTHVCSQWPVFTRPLLAGWARSLTVSEEHYLTVTNDLFERAAKCAAAGSRMDSQGDAKAGEAELEVPDADVANRACASARVDFGTSGARTRTGDLGIMKPTL